MPEDPDLDLDLDRFVLSQAPIYDEVLQELRGGRKTGHWIWFIFPQIAGLGYSETSRYYAISSLDEARSYLVHPVLGPRLHECAGVVAATEGRTAEQMFGPVDAMKVRSSMTLFLRAAPGEAVFRQVLDSFFGGAADPATDRLLGRQAGEPSPGGLSPG